MMLFVVLRSRTWRIILRRNQDFQGRSPSIHMLQKFFDRWMLQMLMKVVGLVEMLELDLYFYVLSWWIGSQFTQPSLLFFICIISQCKCWAIYWWFDIQFSLLESGVWWKWLFLELIYLPWHMLGQTKEWVLLFQHVTKQFIPASIDSQALRMSLETQKQVFMLIWLLLTYSMSFIAWLTSTTRLTRMH